MFGNDEEMKKKKLQEFLTEFFPKFSKNLENCLTGDYFVGNSLTYADLFAVNMLTELTGIIGAKWKEGTPKLAELIERVLNLPRIKAWIEKRPATKM